MAPSLSLLAGHPAWTRDGRRPWHHRFTVRPHRGSALGVWIGAQTPLRGALVYTASLTGGESYHALCGAPWPDLVVADALPDRTGIAPHPGDCSGCGWIGVGEIPRDPRPPTSAWPGWTHLAHAPRCDRAASAHRCDGWQALIPTYERLLTTDPAEWPGVVRVAVWYLNAGGC